MADFEFTRELSAGVFSFAVDIVAEVEDLITLENQLLVRTLVCWPDGREFSDTYRILPEDQVLSD